ncbi:MAG: hypothetical protein KF821_09235 [Anaerolineales bacterium]|jgi:hypothetical protein|nr:hypothetical protein [Anaerolineales bacterium]MBX3005991.1 hypothetical protein [Anaerolineales bacterium]MCW5838652.1 hypothetical protein [Anaerolineales bacterium]MCW5887914.1 hypothetical protein [Anaerolineales bacterium]
MAEINESRRAALTRGLWVAMMLAVLTFGEYLVGVIAPPWGKLLLVVAAFKAFFVITEYMHVGRLFSSGEEH